MSQPATKLQVVNTSVCLLREIVGSEAVAVINCYLPVAWDSKAHAVNAVWSSMSHRHRGSASVLFLQGHDLEVDIMMKELEGRVKCRRGLPQNGELGLMTFHAFHEMSKAQTVVQKGICVLMDFDRPSIVRLRAIAALFKQIREMAHEVGNEPTNWKEEKLDISVVSFCADDFVGIRRLLPYGLVSLVGDKAAATPDLEFKPGDLSASSMSPTIKSGKHVVVIGDHDVAATCKAISAELKCPYQEVKSTARLEDISSLIDKESVPAGAGTIIWVQFGRHSCPLPIRNVGLVFSTMPEATYFDGQSGRSLKGPYIDQREARYQHGYRSVDFGPNVPVVSVGYTAKDVRGSGQGTIVNTEGNAYVDAINILNDWSGVHIHDMAFPLSREDEMALRERLRQLSMMGVVESNPTHDTFSSTPRTERVSQVYRGLGRAKFFKGLVSACFIAGIDAGTGMSADLKRIIIRMGVVSAGFSRIFESSVWMKDLVPFVRGPGRDQARRGFMWMALGLWESAVGGMDIPDLQAQSGHSEAIAVCEGNLQMVVCEVEAAMKLIAKLEGEFGLAGMSAPERRRLSEMKLTPDDVRVIDELLLWAGLYNLVLIPKTPTASVPSLTLDTYSPVSWGRTEIGYDLNYAEPDLLHPKFGEWLGVAYGFYAEGDCLATDSVTLIPMGTLPRVTNRWGVGSEEVLRSRYWNRRR